MYLSKISVKLPIWKIKQLAPFCRRLNYIKHEVFRQRTHLQILCGSDLSSSILHIGKKFMRNLANGDMSQHGDFDLVLKYPPQKSQIAINLTVKHDLFVSSSDEMAKLKQMFPNVKNLTVAFGCESESGDLNYQLLSNWPELTCLRLVVFHFSYIIHIFGDLVSALNEMSHLKHVSLYLNKTLNNPLRLAPMLRNSKQLKTLGIDDCIKFDIEFFFPMATGRFEFTEPELFDVFERINEIKLFRYRLDFPQINLITDATVTSKIRRLEVILTEGPNLRLLSPIQWSSLQRLNLTIVISFGSFSQILEPLSQLQNLRYLQIELPNCHISKKSKFVMPLESIARRWPQVPSVKSFQLSGQKMEPHQLYRFKFAFPNATQITLDFSLYLKAGEDCDDFEESDRPKLCDCCWQTIRRAVHMCHNEVKNIDRFYWIYNNTPNGQELIPKLELLTRNVGGRKCVNFDLITIE